MARDPFRHHDATSQPKRKRIVTSCNQCRKKKVKCDKARPICGGCIKNGLQHECLYQEPSWGSETKLSSNYEVAASIPMAHISVDSYKRSSASPIAPHSNINSQQQLERNNQQMNMSPKKKQKKDCIILPPPQQSMSSTPSSSPSVTPQFTFGPNQPSIMGPPMSYSDNLFKLRDKVQYTESNLRQENSNGSNLPNIQHKSSVGSSFSSASSQPRFISFYDYQEPVQVRAGRLIAAGPLSFNSLVRKDPYLKVILLKIRKQKRIMSIPWKDRTIKSSELVNEIILEEKGSKNTRSKHIDEKFKATLIQNEGIDEVKAKKNPPKVSRMDYESETIAKIEEVLPEEKLIWVLVDRFFDGVLAAFLPFISETTFREKVQELIGFRKDEKRRVNNLTITKRFDFAYIGELLIILRLTYLSVSKTSNNSLEELYILENPIGMNVVQAAEMCLNQFKLLRRGALPIIQFSLFMRFYHKFAPEDGDGADGGDSQVFLGMILQMGNSIGLNRDLSHSDRLKTHSRIVNLWRMIWHEIVTLDLQQSLHIGNPILVDENYYDTGLPVLESKREDYTLKNFDIHHAVIKNFEINNELNKYIRDILKDVLNITKMLNIDELLPKLVKLEVFIEQNFGTLETIYALKNYTIQDNIFKIFKFITYIESRAALFILYYNVYINNPRENFNILLKILSYAMELSPLAYLMITTNNEKTNYFDAIFGSGSQLLIIPSITISLQKVHKVMVGLVARCLDIKFNHPDTRNAAIFEQIRVDLFKTLDVILNGYQTLSSDYYQAWRFCKGSVYIFNLLSDLDNNLFDKESKMNLECIEGNVADEVNHYKSIPSFNELTEFTDAQIQQLYDLVHTEHYKDSLLKWLNKKGKSTKSKTPSASFNMMQSQAQTPTSLSSVQLQPTNSNSINSNSLPYSNNNGIITTPGSVSSAGSSEGSGGIFSSSNGFHINKNTRKETEIDQIWFQKMATSNNENGTAVNQDITNQGGMVYHSPQVGQDVFGLLDENSNVNSFLDFDPFGALDLEKLMADGETTPFDVFGDTPFFNEA